MRVSSITLSAAVALATFATPVLAEPVYGLVSQQVLGFPALVKFDSATPAAMSNPIALTGVASGQALRAIDFRPSTGALYALSSAGPASDGSGTSNGGAAAQLYTVNLTTGALTAVGTGFSITGNTSGEVSIDFNPVVDRLRIVTGTGQNLRLNPNDGTIAGTDGSISGSPNGSFIAAVAYTNNFVGATSTTLYGYDYLSDELDTIGSVGGATSPNTGTRFVVGTSGLFSNATNIGLDIDAAGAAFASVYDSGLGNYGFYSVNLGTGAFQLIGSEGLALQDFAVQSPSGVAAVPEPGSLALLGLGLAATVAASRRRARRG